MMPHMNRGWRRRWLVSAGAAFITLVLIVGVWLFHQFHATALAAEVSASSPHVTNDDRQIFAKYGGSESCKDCHRREYDLWSASNHGLAERNLRPEMDRKAFEPARSFKHGSQTTTVRIQGGQSQIITLGFKTNVEA